jgi:DNA-directed RNA polymerase subunit RPC12/RpoP
MTFKYRCTRCRVRNTFKRQVDDYIRPKKCRACGHDRFYWDKEMNAHREICGCTGGYHFTHRKGSRLCVHNKWYELHDRLRQGQTEAEALLEMSLSGTLPGAEEAVTKPPF